MKTNKALQASYGTLLGTNADIAEVLDKTKNIWMYTFLEIFKEMLNRFSGVDVEELLASDPKKFEDMYISPIINKVNTEKWNQFYDKFEKVPENEDTFEVSGLKADFYDLNQEIPSTRIINPMPYDIAPDITISETVFMEPVDGSIAFPFESIPVMNIIPGTGGVYHRYHNMYNRYFIKEIAADVHERANQSSILEISLKSLMKDYSSLSQEYNPETQSLSDEGMSTLKTIVLKYTDFVLPLVMINLRKNYEFGCNLVDIIYNYFANNYASAMVSQRYMYSITNALIYSRAGSALLRGYSLQYATSTLDIMNPEYKYASLVNEEIGNTTGCDCIKNYIKYRENVFDLVPITNYIGCEREATRDVMKTLLNSILEILSCSVSVNGTCYLSKALAAKLCDIVGAFRCEISPMNYVDQVIVQILNITPEFIERELLPKIASVQMVKMSSTTPGFKSNQNQFTPIAQEIMGRNEMSRANVVGTNSAALESNQYLKDIADTGISNEFMRMIAVECENISTVEDAEIILSEARMCKEAFKLAKITNETAEIQQFRIFLNNVETQVLNWKSERM